MNTAHLHIKHQKAKVAEHQFNSKKYTHVSHIKWAGEKFHEINNDDRNKKKRNRKKLEVALCFWGHNY